MKTKKIIATSMIVLVSMIMLFSIITPATVNTGGNSGGINKVHGVYGGIDRDSHVLRCKLGSSTVFIRFDKLVTDVHTEVEVGMAVVATYDIVHEGKINCYIYPGYLNDDGRKISIINGIDITEIIGTR